MTAAGSWCSSPRRNKPRRSKPICSSRSWAGEVGEACTHNFRLGASPSGAKRLSGASSGSLTSALPHCLLHPRFCQHPGQARHNGLQCNAPGRTAEQGGGGQRRRLGVQLVLEWLRGVSTPPISRQLQRTPNTKPHVQACSHKLRLLLLPPHGQRVNKDGNVRDRGHHAAAKVSRAGAGVGAAADTLQQVRCTSCVWAGHAGKPQGLAATSNRQRRVPEWQRRQAAGSSQVDD